MTSLASSPLMASSLPSDGRHPDDCPPRDPAASCAVSSDQILDVLEVLLDATPTTSLTGRLETYQRCARLLSRITAASVDSVLVKFRCADLHRRLRRTFPEATGSYMDPVRISGLETASLHSRVVLYLSAALAEARNGDRFGSRILAADLVVMIHDIVFWMHDNDHAGVDELLRMLREMQSACREAGVRIISDDHRSLFEWGRKEEEANEARRREEERKENEESESD